MSLTRRALVSFEDGPPAGAQEVLLLRPDWNLRTGVSDFAASFTEPTTLERDLLTVAAAIYACDLAFKRGEREEVTRSIELTIPVANFHAFERLNDRLTYILWLLSHDNWTVKFRRMRGAAAEEETEWAQSKGRTLLFSGGLDSLAGAVDLFDEFGVEGVQLASHVTANPVTRQSQESLAGYLEGAYRASLRRVVVRTGGRNHRGYEFPSDDEREETQRTRSFMFLTIAALAARRSGKSEVVMIAENGQMAIHLPLSAARIGAFSTHTAHPEFVHLVGEFFTELLGFPIRVVNPYLYKTKAETIAKLVSQHREAVKMSVSCWRGSRLSRDFNHCGECVPCLIRRVSTEFNWLVLPEYARDLLGLDINALATNDEGRRNVTELAEFAYTFDSRRDAEIEFDYPDLFNVHIDRDQAIAMYRRFAGEARQVLDKYSGIKSLFPMGALSPPSAAGSAPATGRKKANASTNTARKTGARKKRG
jgi:7-cyano-7-deazaguanine synthase in queuosine biosynthesis